MTSFKPVETGWWCTITVLEKEGVRGGCLYYSRASSENCHISSNLSSICKSFVDPTHLYVSYYSMYDKHFLINLTSISKFKMLPLKSLKNLLVRLIFFEKSSN